VSVHPSMAMSRVAANRFAQKNTHVNMVMWVSFSIDHLFMFDAMNISDSPACNIQIFYRQLFSRYWLVNCDQVTVNNVGIIPIQNCTGTNHVLCLPMRREYMTSTNGAHNSFKLYGKSTTPNFACIGNKNRILPRISFYSDNNCYICRSYNILLPADDRRQSLFTPTQMTATF